MPAPFVNPGKDRIGEIWFEATDGPVLPLMVKYLFTSEKLSVQVHPSQADPHPLITSEGACMGLPMIYSDRIGAVGPTDIAREGENVIVYPCGDTAALNLPPRSRIANWPRAMPNLTIWPYRQAASDTPPTDGAF